MTSIEELNRSTRGKLPGYLGLEVTGASSGRVVGRFEVRPHLVTASGYLFGGVVMTVADILCGFGVSTAWPNGAMGFTTVEVTCNFMGALHHGAGLCTARLLHGGHTTQVWDADVVDEESGRLLAVFRCTQVFSYRK